MSWTDEREKELLAAVGAQRPVSQETVAKAADKLDVSTRSVSAKLRKMDVEVDKVEPRGKKYSEAEEAALVKFLKDNPLKFTYAEIAEKFAGGKFSAKQVQGKILSLELTKAVKPTPKKETTKTYTDAEEVKFIKLAKGGAFLEDIADALGKTVASVRGKALSLTRTDTIESIPPLRDKVEHVDPIDALGDISDMTVEEMAEKTGKTVRGIKTIITRRKLRCKNYGKAKAA